MSFDSATKAAAMAHETSQCILKCIDIEHSDITTIRLVNNTVDITRNGNTYQASNFEIDLPSERSDQMPICTLKIENINLVVSEAALTADKMEQATVTLNVVRASAPDVSQRGPLRFVVKHISADDTWASIKLAYEDIMNQKFPEGDMNPGDFPGLF